MKTQFKLSAAVLLVVTGLAGCSYNSVQKEYPNNTLKYPIANSWYQNGAKVVENAVNKKIQTAKGKAKNIILFVGDGMGISTVTAARILAGQQQGKLGEEHQLSFDKFPFTGLSKTYNTNQQTPDSAGTMTAMITGVKSKAGMISVSEASQRANCKTSKGNELVSALEMAESIGKATGIVSTARITHATPAATYAKSPERNWESDNKLTDEARANGCKDIADQLLSFKYGDGIEVVMGGGRRHFIPKEFTDVEGKRGKRKDGRNLMAEWQAKHPNGLLVQTQAEFDAINANTEKVFGLFNSSHMRYEADRSNDVGGEPSIAEMTSKAIDVLSKDKDGFFLMVESGRIDHGHHAGSAYNALTDTIAFAEAVQAAVDKTSAEDTLIIVTADHSHVFTIAGYPTRGNPILGKVISNDSSGNSKGEVQLAADDMPYSTLGYINGLGFADLGNETNADIRYKTAEETGRVDLTDINTEASGFHQEALVPLSAETHAGEDVGIYASGPGAHLVSGVVEQNVIFHIMSHMGGLQR